MTVLYFAFFFCQIYCELQVIDVNNYCDLSIHMKNAGDELHINVPEKTLFFVSSTDGYEVFALVTIFVPNEMNRLFYTHHMNTFFVTSTKDNIDFCFHTLVLTKIQVPVDHIFISSNPSERFYIYHLDLLDNEDPTDCLYNATFSKNHLIWFLGDNRTLCDITTRIYEPYTNLQDKYTGRLTYPSSFAFPFTDPTNESNIYFETIYLTMANKITLTSKSKLIYIEKVKKLYYGFTSYFQMECKPENETNYYIDYRAYVNYTELSDNKVITRGKEHYEKLQKLIIYNGITYIDFSIYNNYYIESSGYILIFPKITEMSSNILFDDNITFMYKHNKELTFNSAIDHVAETDIKAPIIAIDEYYFNNIDSYFILSTCPTEKLIIGSSYQNDINYTNDEVYQYIMGSLQDIQTTITFEGKVTIAKIESEDIKNITINSGDTIDGCFIAYIEKYATCKFETSPKGELKKGYYDDARTMFKNPRNLKENLFISPKYGDYYNTTVSFKNESVSFENRDFQIVSTFNLVYVQNKDGWNAEVLYPKVKEYNKIGPEYNITSFYFSKLPKGRRVVIKFNKENNDDDFVLKIRTTSTEYINQGDDYYCQRLVLFNEFPSKYSVNFKQNSKYRQINLDYYETFCMFPAISDFYYGRNKAYFDHYNAYGIGFGFAIDDKIEDETYCQNITTYYNFQSETYPILILKWTSNLGNIAFKSATSLYYDDPDDLLPDEPKFYINTKINRTFGIHPLENQYEDIGNTEDDSDDDDNGNDDPDDDKQNVNIELVNVSSYEEVNMESFVNYTIKSGSYSLIIIHSNKNIEAEVFVKENGNTKSIGTIKSNSADKIIYYGVNEGYILVRKSSKNTRSSSDLDNKFIYSYINLRKVDYLDSYKCNDILISSDPYVNFSIGGPESKETAHFNHTLSNEDRFCMWFPFPIVAIVSSNSYLPNFQSLVVDKKQLELSYTEYAFAGKSFLYVFKYGSSKLNDRNATYNAEPKYSSDISKLSSFYKINKIFKLDGKYGILSDKPKVVEKSDKKKFEINIAVIAYIAAAVIVIVIIIVVIVVCVKKKNKMKVSNNEEDVNAQNLSNQNNLQPNQTYPAQNYPNQNYPNQTYPAQTYPYPPNPSQAYPKPYQNQTYQNQFDPNQSCQNNQNQNDQETP